MSVDSIATKRYSFRPQQKKAFEALADKRLVIANMPTGWGKGFLLSCLGASDLLDPQRKIIICVPQRIIAKGFLKQMTVRLPDGREACWKIVNNLCAKTPAKVLALGNFLVRPASSKPECRVVITTHMTLACAFSRLEPHEVEDAFRHVTLICDEGHHVQASDEGTNRLGKVIVRLLEIDDPTTRIVLATAYFFRGDHLPIISDADLTRFLRYHIPFDEYWTSLTHLKSYSYDFVAFKGTVFPEMESLLKAEKQPTIIYCPPVGHKLLAGKGKDDFVRRVARLAQKHLSAKMWTPTCTASAGRFIVDLVDKSHRQEKINFIAKHGKYIAAVLTVGMFKEGADWVEASRIIDLVPTGSDQDRLQRFGRLVRDCPDKPHVGYFSFFPFIADKNEEERRRQLSRLYAHFHTSLILENAIRPLRVPTRLKARSRLNQNSPSEHRLNLLGSLSTSAQETILRASTEALIRLHDDRMQAGQSVTHDDARKAVVQVVEENGVIEHQEEMAKQILLIMRRKADVHLDVDDLVLAGFDKVWSSNCLDGLISYSAGAGGPDTLSEIRRVVDGVFEQQWLENYEKLKGLSSAPSSQSSAHWWCTHNRVLNSQGRLPEAKRRMLEGLPWWQWAQAFEDRWQQRFEAIRQLPSCPKASTSEYAWVRQQRRLSANKRLSKAKIRSLQSIPWWKWASLDRNWDKSYAGISKLRTPPLRATTEYEWARTQRKLWKSGRLLADRAERLEQISWWTWRGSRRPRRPR